MLVKNVAKTRFLLGLAHLIAENAQTNSFINVQIRLGEIVTMLQTLESIAVAAVEGAVENPDNGVWYCNANAITRRAAAVPRVLRADHRPHQADRRQQLHGRALGGQHGGDHRGPRPIG